MSDQDKSKEQLVAELVEARQALLERDARLLEAQEVASIGFYVLDIPTNHWKSSLVLDRIFGIPDDFEKTIEAWGTGLLHPADRQEILDYLNSVVTANKPFDCEYRIVRYNDKQVRWIHALGRVQVDEDGQPVSMLGTVQDITDRKQVEETLRQSEERLRRFYESGLLGVIYWNMNGQITDANNKFLEMVGYERADLAAGRIDWIQMTPPEYRQINDLSVKELKATGSNKAPFEKEYIRKDGQRVPIIIAGTMLDEERFHGVAFVLDITERKRAEELLQQAHDELELRVKERTAELSSANAQLTVEVEQRQRAQETLRESERRFRNYFEQGLIGMAVTSVDKRWVEVNDRLCEILGYAREELLQKTWADLTYPDDLEPNLQFFNPLVACEIDNYTLNKRYLKKDGSIVHTRLHTRSFRQDDGTIDHIVALIEDISESKKAEEALRHSEERYRAVVEDQTEVICRIKADGTFVFVNDVFCRFFGKSSHDLLGSKWHPNALPEDVPMIEEHLRTLSPGNPIVIIENRVYSGLGEVRWMQFVNRGRFAKDGRLIEIQSVGRDITERKKAQSALERERRTLKYMLKASDHERRLISYDIHDGLAQELAGAIMQFQIFGHARQANPKEAAKAYAAAMTMLQQSYAEARRLITGVRPPILDESGVIAAIAHSIYDPAFDQGPKIELRNRVTFKRLAPILENVIYRIVQEGLTNARNHSKSKKIRVSLMQRGDRLRIEIRDWGVGFDPKIVRDNHFGLEGIRERARVLGGKCNIKSTLGAGSSIVVELPVVEGESE